MKGSKKDLQSGDELSDHERKSDNLKFIIEFSVSSKIYANPSFYNHHHRSSKFVLKLYKKVKFEI